MDDIILDLQSKLANVHDEQAFRHVEKEFVGITGVIKQQLKTLKDLSPEEKAELLNPHPRWGIRGDYIWVTE